MASNVEKFKSDGSLGGNVLEWVDARFPLMTLYREHLSEYYAPKNFNFWYFFGSLALLVLVNQIVTGIFLVMVRLSTWRGASIRASRRRTIWKFRRTGISATPRS